MTSKIPLILTSSKASPEIFKKHKALPTRADDYIIKPFQLEELTKKVNSLMGKIEITIPTPSVILEPSSTPATQDTAEAYETTSETAKVALDQIKKTATKTDSRIKPGSSLLQYLLIGLIVAVVIALGLVFYYYLMDG